MGSEDVLHLGLAFGRHGSRHRDVSLGQSARSRAEGAARYADTKRDADGEQDRNAHADIDEDAAEYEHAARNVDADTNFRAIDCDADGYADVERDGNSYGDSDAAVAPITSTARAGKPALRRKFGGCVGSMRRR